MEAEVTGGEVELLVIGGIIGNMHLPVDACDGTVFLEYHSGVVVETRSPTFKEGGDKHHTKLLGEFAIEFGGGTRDGFREVEVVDILDLTEIQGVVELLQNDHLSPALGEVCNAFRQAQDVLMEVCAIGLL